jgi:hypothetical protein
MPTETLSPEIVVSTFDEEHTQTEDDDACPNSLTMLFELAAIVGDNGREVVERVMRGLAAGSPSVYRAELNRLTAKYILSITPAR